MTDASMDAAFGEALVVASGGGEVEIVRDGAPEVGTLSACEMFGIIATIADARARAAMLIATRSAPSQRMGKSTATAEDYRAIDDNDPEDPSDGEWVWVLLRGDRSRGESIWVRYPASEGPDVERTNARAKPVLVRNGGDAGGQQPDRRHDNDAFVDALAERISARLDDRLGHAEEEEILLDYTRTAERLCTTVAALKARVQRGQMPEGSIVRIGRRVMFKVEALRRAQPSRRKVK